MQPHVDIAERPVSSSAIRMALAEGQIEDATAMLGGPWFVAGEVIHGEKRGRDLGYPTANIRLDKNCGLKHGIYAVRVGRGARSVSTASPVSAAARPSTMARRCWKFSCSISRATSMETLDIAFIGFIRDELKFDSVDALVRQMGDDSTRARAALAAAPGAFPKLGVIGSPPPDERGLPSPAVSAPVPGATGMCRRGFAIRRLAAMESRMFARRTINISGPASA